MKSLRRFRFNKGFRLRKNMRVYANRWNERYKNAILSCVTWKKYSMILGVFWQLYQEFIRPFRHCWEERLFVIILMQQVFSAKTFCYILIFIKWYLQKWLVQIDLKKIIKFATTINSVQEKCIAELWSHSRWRYYSDICAADLDTNEL